MGCIFRPTSQDDFGIDGEIEVVMPTTDGKGLEPTGGVVKVQSKSGSSYVIANGAERFATPVEKVDLEYWYHSNFPVFLIVYHPSDDKLYWKDVKNYIDTTPNVFERPWRVIFDKKTDEFNS